MCVPKVLPEGKKYKKSKNLGNIKDCLKKSVWTEHCVPKNWAYLDLNYPNVILQVKKMSSLLVCLFHTGYDSNVHNSHVLKTN